VVVVSIETIANRLAPANDFVQVAGAVFALTSELFQVVECSLSLHSPDGRPVLTVDNLRLSSDEPRLQRMVAECEREPLPRSLMEGANHILVMPLIYPRGLLGQMRCCQPTPFSADARHDLQTVAMAASVRLTELRVQPGDDPRLARLTMRQRDVARLAGKGMSNADIGRTLDLSHNTIKKHLKDVFETLEVTSRAQLAVLMCDMGPMHDYPRGITRVDGITIVRSAL
jgi:DNA-binding CsgD family transcriptional regulator